MYGIRRHRPIAGIVGSLLVLAVAASAVAQEAKPGVLDQLEETGGLKSPFDDSRPSKVTISATLQGSADPRRATLFVTAEIAEGFHIYSITQKPGGPIASKIKLDESDDYKLAGGITAQDKPKSHVDNEIWKRLTIEEHEGKVTWSAPVELTAGAKAENVKVTGKVIGQVCDAGSCQDFSAPFTAAYSKPQNVGQYRAERSHVTLAGHVNVQSVAPGAKFKLHLSAQPDADWHVYALADREPKELGPRPTLIVMTGAAAGQSSKPAADSKVVEKDDQRYYEGPVTWTIEVTAPKTVKPGETFLVAGILGYQTCKTNSACDTPQAVRFSADLSITETTTGGSLPVVFTPAKYPEAAKAAELAAASAPPPLDPRTFAWVIGASLLGGFILNLMPCVLPVVGLKILSFVEQAHHERGQILALNIAYTGGILAVFMALAALSAGLGQAWGEQFTSKEFNIALAVLVFVMALSFLGVWEIPIPGFVGSSRAGELAQREGLAGAFAKGVLTTILATPCSGPALGFVFGFMLGQPAYVIFTVFGCIGLGMAAPYLLIGAFPQFMRFLPKPGEWMETFKQSMGFVLLGTVVFVFTFLDKDYLVPTFGLMVGLWFCCWWIGRTPLTEPAAARLRAWGAGIAVAAAVGWLSFTYLGPPRRILPWEPFSQSALAKATAEGKTVMIDFTADWCLTCKLNMKWAVDTEETLRLVNENKIVPLLADWTKPNSEIKETLNALGSNSIPVLAIFPAGRSEQPIVLRDLLKQGDVLEALREAGPSASPPTSAAAVVTQQTAMQTR